MNDLIYRLARRLIAVPGYTELPEKETRVALELEAILWELGLEPELRDYSGRFNVVATVDSGLPGPHVVLCTHLDTVPPYDMADPFRAVLREGKLYGRGAVDVRGTLAAMAVALANLNQRKSALRGKVSLLAVADEESGSFGMRQEVARGFVGDVTIVGEPTELKLGVAHKGVCWDEVEFFGKSAHGSVPWQGRSAILDAVAFLNLMETTLVPALVESPHPLLGPATVNVGRMEGGTRPTIVPERCRLQIDRRLIPGETCQTAFDGFQTLLDRLAQQRPGLRGKQTLLLGGPDKPFPPLDCSRETGWIEAICRAAAPIVGHRPEIVGLPFWTDAALAAWNTGKAAFVLGPGSIAQAHANDEYVLWDQLEQAAVVYETIGLALCGKENPYENRR